MSYIERVMADNGKQDIGGTPRATKRPANVKAPSNWTASPLPEPERALDNVYA